MNSLIIYPEEGWSEGLIELVGERAREVASSQLCDIGRELRVAVFGGDKGIGVVREGSSERVVIELVSRSPSLPLRSVDLIVGLSRPQTNKKVIQAAVMSGVRSLHLVHLHSGQKSYLDSHLLHESQLRHEVVKALEQIWEGHYPPVHVHQDFGRFMRKHRDLLSLADNSVKVVAQPGAALDMSSMLHCAYTAAALAVGSEGGWSEGELHTLVDHGFSPVGLGQRVVRVEVALLYLLGRTLHVS